MYVTQFRDACNRLGLNFKMPAMSITIDDENDSRVDAALTSTGQSAAVMWQQSAEVSSSSKRQGSQLAALAMQVCSDVTTQGQVAHAPADTNQHSQNLDALEILESDANGDGEIGNASHRHQPQQPARVRKRLQRLQRANSAGGSSCRSFASYSNASEDGGGTIVSVSASSASASGPHETQQQQLLTLCSQQRRQLAFENTSVRAKNAQIKSLKRQIARLQTENKRLKRNSDNDPNKAFMIQERGQQKGGKAGRFTLGSWFSIAFRKCLTNMASTDFGLATMSDISGSTVLRSEVRTAAGLVHCFHLFMAEALEFVVSCNQNEGTGSDESQEQQASNTILPLGLPSLQGDTGNGNEQPDKLEKVPANVEWSAEAERTWSVVAIGFRSDATNAIVWRRKKLSVAFCKVLWIQDFDQLKRGNFEKAAVVRKSVQLVDALQ